MTPPPDPVHAQPGASGPPRGAPVAHEPVSDRDAYDALSAHDDAGSARPHPSGASPLAVAHLAGSMSPAQELAAPLAALAAAFQANADALRRSHELQADLGQALQRADRSAALVQNTGALNETFKGLTQVQRSLIQQVEESGKSTRANRWLLPTLVIAALAVMGGAMHLVVTRMEQVESDSIGRGDYATQLSAARREGEAAGRGAVEESLATERRSAESRLAEREDELRKARTDLDASEARAKRLETELLAASAEIQGARTDSLRAKALEGELLTLRAEQAVRGPEAERLRIELEGERRTVADLRRRLADASLGRTPTAPDASDASKPPDPREDRDLVRDRRVLETARARLNEVLEAGAAGRGDSLRITSIGSVSGFRVGDVTAERTGAGGRLMNTYKARELRITVDRPRRVVEFTFSQGSLEYAGSSIPFPGGAATIVVAEGDAITGWLGTGLTFIGSR